MRGICSIPDCGLPHYARGFCSRHYNQWRRDPDGVGAPIREAGPPRWARDAEMRKWCHSCSRWLEEARFAASRNALDGLQHACRDCRSNYYRQNSGAVRDTMRARRFGLSPESFRALLESQGGVCAVCGTSEPGPTYWHTDHDHSCCPGGKPTCGGCVRGILCGACNLGLGKFRDNPALLEAAATYLRNVRARAVARSVK